MQSAIRRWSRSCCQDLEAFFCRVFSMAPHFLRAFSLLGGPDAVSQWQELMAELKPMSEALYNSPPFGALRDDPFAPITLGRYTR